MFVNDRLFALLLTEVLLSSKRDLSNFQLAFLLVISSISRMEISRNKYISNEVFIIVFSWGKKKSHYTDQSIFNGVCSTIEARKRLVNVLRKKEKK